MSMLYFSLLVLLKVDVILKVGVAGHVFFRQCFYNSKDKSDKCDMISELHVYAYCISIYLILDRQYYQIWAWWTTLITPLTSKI